MADKQISDLTSASAMTDGSLFVIEQGGAAKSANWGMVKNYISPGVAAQYSSSSTYAVGDYVIYNDTLYRCITAITTAESWTAAHWTATVLCDDIGDLESALSETTRNIWKWGDQSIISANHVTINNASIPAGTYALSANPQMLNDNGNCRMVFYKNSISASNLLANPYIQANNGRKSVSFTLAEQADIIVVRWSVDGSSTGTTYWKDIQIESGTSATEYIPHITAKDSIAREEIEKTNANFAPFEVVKELVGVYSGETTITKTVELTNMESLPFVLCIDAKYEVTNSSTKYPYITTSIITDRNFERTSMRYKVGENGKYDLKSIRSIPYVWDNRKVTINLTVPAACTLTIRNAYCYFERSRNNTESGIQFHAHDGSCNIAPPQTLASYKMALEGGYNSAIVIPKITSDGVWFAYHDDTFEISTTNLKNMDGTSISSSEYDGMYFNQIPWSYLSQFKVGNYGATFNDVGLMKLDDFFLFCSMTGIQPMFSMHPRFGIQTTETLTSLKNLVNKHGLLDRLIIKMPLVVDDGVYTLSNFTTIYNVFGDDVFAYEVDAVDGMENPESVIAMLQNVSSGVKTKLVIEYWITQLYADSSLANAVLSAGFGLSCAITTHTDISGDTITTGFTSEDVKQLVAMGVTEFTEQYNTSNGLYW